MADRLAGEARAGRMNDVDYVRIRRAWQLASGPTPTGSHAFTDAVLRDGAAACAHPSGRPGPAGPRGPARPAAPRQVRIGPAPGQRPQPVPAPGRRHRARPRAARHLAARRRTARVRQDRGTSSGRSWSRSACRRSPGRPRSSRWARPAPTSGPAAAFDVVIALGDPSSALRPRPVRRQRPTPTRRPGCSPRRCSTGSRATRSTRGGRRPRSRSCSAPSAPRTAASPRCPSCGNCSTAIRRRVAALREALDDGGQPGMVRELDARARQSGRPGDIGALLADRVALLDRPAFAGFFDVTGRTRPFSLQLAGTPAAGPDRPAGTRSRRGVADAGPAAARPVHRGGDRSRRTARCSPAWCWTTPRTPSPARRCAALQRLRSAHAGAVLTLRTLDDVPESLRGALLGAVGCRMASCRACTTWDGKRFAEAWGTAWVEDPRRHTYSGPVRRHASSGSCAGCAGCSPGRRPPPSR